MHGMSTIPPINVLTQLNVNGPTYSIPTLCATNALPHMIAANNNNNIPFICFFFIPFNPSFSFTYIFLFYYVRFLYASKRKRRNISCNLVFIGLSVYLQIPKSFIPSHFLLLLICFLTSFQEQQILE